MDSSELTYMKKYNIELCCGTNGRNIGPTGSPGPSATIKSFSIFLGYGSQTGINRIYIPPGLFTIESGLSEGGTYTEDVGPYLVFSNLSSVTFTGLSNTMAAYINVLGYLSNNQWQQIPGVNIGSGATKINFYVTESNALLITNLILGNINGGQTISTSTFPFEGFLGCITITFI